MQPAASQEEGPTPVPAPAKPPTPAPVTEKAETPAPVRSSSGPGARVLVLGQKVIRKFLKWPVRILSVRRRAETASTQEKSPCVTREIRIGEHCIFEISIDEGSSILKHVHDFEELHSRLHGISPNQCRLLPAFPKTCDPSAGKVCDDLHKWLSAAWQCRKECEWDKDLERFCSTWSLAEDIHRFQYLHEQSYVPMGKVQQFAMKRCQIPCVSSESNFCSCILSSSILQMVSGRHWQVCIRFEGKGENGKDLLVPFLCKKGAVSTADLEMLEEWFSKWVGIQPGSHTDLDGVARSLAVFAGFAHVGCARPEQVGRKRPALKGAIVMAVPLVLSFVLGVTLGFMYQALEFSASGALSPYIVAFALITTEQWLVPSLRAYLFICWAWMLCLRALCEACPHSELETALALTIFGGCLFVALYIMGVQRELHAEVLDQSDGSPIVMCYSGMLRAMPEEWGKHLHPYFMWAKESSGWKGMLLVMPAGWLLFPIGLVGAELFRYNSGSACRRIAAFVIGQRTRVLIALICGFILGAIPGEPLQFVSVMVNSEACVGKLLFLGHFFLRRKVNTYWSSFMLVIVHVVGNFLALKPWLQERSQFKQDMDAFPAAVPALWSAITIQGLGVVVSAFLLGRDQYSV